MSEFNSYLKAVARLDKKMRNLLRINKDLAIANRKLITEVGQLNRLVEIQSKYNSEEENKFVKELMLKYEKKASE